MAELTTVARPYAEAAFRSAVEAGSVASTGTQLARMGAAMATREASSVLGNPRVATSEKASLITSVAGGDVSAMVANLVRTLIDYQRASLLPFISEHFQRLQRDHEGVTKATITSAFALRDDDRKGLVDALAKKYGKKIDAEVVIDPSLIGGARIQVGDEVIHASVRDALDKMTTLLQA